MEDLKIENVKRRIQEFGKFMIPALVLYTLAMTSLFYFLVNCINRRPDFDNFKHCWPLDNALD